ncbi:MAG: nucleoside 2-deoxyribosyltransferase [Pseudonocardia sp.]|nr:nucleoside 2-deoxyribosyltransferase [Pseudonocardia sp.]
MVEPVKIDAPGENALVFGILEGEPEVRAAAIVYDPQRPRGPRAISRDRLCAGRFGVVANAAETRALSGLRDLEASASKIAVACQADVVVVKRGALGSLVCVPGEAVRYVGPCRTEQVWPIGSGDVFSAVFAWGWLEAGLPPFEAARLASAGASAWCGSRRLPVGLRPGVTPEEIASGPFLAPPPGPVRVYLAGPFFDVGSRWVVSLASQVLAELGATVFSPFHEVGPGGDEVAEKDLKGLRDSHSVLALLDGADPGTMFELGYASARGIPAVGYAEDASLEAYRMVRGVQTPVLGDLSSAVYRAIWAGMGGR